MGYRGAMLSWQSEVPGRITIFFCSDDLDEHDMSNDLHSAWKLKFALILSLGKCMRSCTMRPWMPYRAYEHAALLHKMI
jgi:hypothetical protein